MKTILQNYKVLYVEDEASIRENISQYLQNFFREVIIAKDGKEAIELFYQEYPELIILDIALPYRDGLSVAKEIREANKQVKIIMLSAFSDREKLLKATELKLSKYLIKPVAPKEFKAALSIVANELAQDSLHFITLAPFIIWDSLNEQILKKGKTIELSPKLKNIIKLLIQKRGSLVSYEDIMVYAWEDSFEKEISLGSVKNQISLLRKNIPELKIDSVYKRGYILQ